MYSCSKWNLVGSISRSCRAKKVDVHGGPALVKVCVHERLAWCTRVIGGEQSCNYPVYVEQIAWLHMQLYVVYCSILFHPFVNDSRIFRQDFSWFFIRRSDKSYCINLQKLWCSMETIWKILVIFFIETFVQKIFKLFRSCRDLLTQ